MPIPSDTPSPPPTGNLLVNKTLDGIISELQLLRQADRRDSAKQCYARAIAIVRGKRYDV